MTIVYRPVTIEEHECDLPWRTRSQHETYIRYANEPANTVWWCDYCDTLWVTRINLGGWHTWRRLRWYHRKALKGLEGRGAGWREPVR